MPGSAKHTTDAAKPALILVAGPDPELVDAVVDLLAPTGAEIARAGDSGAWRERGAALTVYVGADTTDESAYAAQQLRDRAPRAPQLVLVEEDTAVYPEHEIAGGNADAIDLISQAPNLLCHRALRLMRSDRDLANLRAARDRAQGLLGLTRAASWELDSEGTLICSPELRRLVSAEGDSGTSPSSLVSLVGEHEREAMEQAIEQALDGIPVDLKHQLASTSDRAARTVETRAQLTEIDGNAVVLGVCLPTSANADAQPQKGCDELTGLPSRASLEVAAAEMQLDALSHGTRMGVIQLGLDDFKRVNKAFGRGFGDEVLRQVADRLRRAMASQRDDAGSAPLVGRFGSDEFAILVPNLGSSGDGTSLARRALETLSEPISFLGNQARVEGCAGIAVGPGEPTDASALLYQAAQALYDAQERGHRQVEFYADGQSTAYDQMKLEARLREAVDREEIHLHYQPKVDIQTGQVRGFEALARWTDAELGPVGPQDFIRAAENAGFIHRIGEQTLRKACLQTVEWLKMGLWQGRMAVNVSPLQFMSESFGDWVLATVVSTGLDPKYVELEITESCLVEHRSTVETLRKVREHGITVAIDDFGTGYSSLQYLRQLPLDALKVDRAFVIDLETDASAQRLLETIVSLAKTLDLKVVAEGVETSGQWSLLRDLGCDEIQGFRVSPGVPPERVPEMLQASKPARESERSDAIDAGPEAGS